MKTLLISLFSLLMYGCNGQTNASSPAQVAEKVVVSFYTQNNETLKQYTTKESYESFMTIQGLLSSGTKKASNFKVLNKKLDGDIAWIEFTSSYSKNPETFKLIHKEGQWKVTEIGLREKSPF